MKVSFVKNFKERGLRWADKLWDNRGGENFPEEGLEVMCVVLGKI